MRRIIPHEENPLLQEKARPLSVEEITSEHTRSLIRDMQNLLSREKYGVAIAAPQVGEPIQLFIVSGRALARDSRNAEDEPKDDDTDIETPEPPPLPDQVYINPEFLKVSRKKEGKHEGCLSIRGKWGIVPRAEKASLRALDENGRLFTRGASGFLAHVFQHEMDHLSGVLYTSKATELYDDEPDKSDE